jgi:hypothetical protein
MLNRKPPENLPPMRILIANEYPASCVAIQDAIVDEFGHAFAIHLSPSEEHGWEQLNTWDYDLLFADEEPWKKFDLLAHVRADERFADLTVVPVTYSTKPEPRLKGVMEVMAGTKTTHTTMIVQQVYDVLRSKYKWTAPEVQAGEPTEPRQ